MWPLLYLPKGEVKYENLNYRDADLIAIIEELSEESFSGYMEILALHEKGLFLFHDGEVVNCFYEGTDELELSKEQILRHFLQAETKERDTIVNVNKLNPVILVALSALEPPNPIHRELESSFLDIHKLVETMARKRFTGVLRYYRIRNNTRLGNLLLKMNKISPEQLKEAIRLQLSNSGAKRLGDALVEIGAIAQSELENALDRQSYTRKGSDLELALSIFYKGEFLGGYSQDNAILIPNLQKIMDWIVGGREILLDIIEGELPDYIDISQIVEAQKAVEGKAVVKSFEERHTPVRPSESINEKKAAAKAAIKELTDETFSLKADDLILDAHSTELPAMSSTVQPSAGPETKSSPSEPEKVKPIQFDSIKMDDPSSKQAAPAKPTSQPVVPRHAVPKPEPVKPVAKKDAPPATQPIASQPESAKPIAKKDAPLATQPIASQPEPAKPIAKKEVPSATQPVASKSESVKSVTKKEVSPASQPELAKPVAKKEVSPTMQPEPAKSVAKKDVPVVTQPVPVEPAKKEDSTPERPPVESKPEEIEQALETIDQGTPQPTQEKIKSDTTEQNESEEKNSAAEQTVPVSEVKAEISNIKELEIPELLPELQGFSEQIIQVMVLHMGFLGKALFTHELKLAQVPGRIMTLAQFRAVVKRVIKLSRDIAGEKVFELFELELNDLVGE